ncbi:MAG: VWA domain-containing protein [Hymenobacteraceae bacterium]|nr:VWA domain-containing protein [Hymenobacteraceae bacterium]
MNWFYPPTLYDGLLAAALALALGVAATRAWRTSQALGQPWRGIWWKLPLRLLTASLLLAALFGPALGTTRKQVRSTGKDVWVVVDVSRSMDAQDVRPSRLERVKSVLPVLLATTGADRVALVAFAGEATLRCPLTFDQTALLLYAGTLQTQQLATGSTDIGAALDTVRAAIRAEAATQPGTGGNSPVVVLITDGEDFGDRATDRTLLVSLVRERVPVMVLGVGTLAGAPVPGARRPATDETPGPPISRLRPDVLRDLAEATGGRFFELSDYRDETRDLATAVAGLRGQMREVKLLQVRANKYQYPLVLALALLVVDVLVTVRLFRLEA